MILAALGALQTVAADPPRQDIPEFYQGKWALDREFCSVEYGPAIVTIGARTILFDEKHGYLELAQLNQATDVPTFYGYFQFADLGRFSEESVRLSSDGKNIFVTKGVNPDDPDSTVPWYRC